MPSRDPVEQPAARDRLEEWMRFFERAQAAGDRAKSLEAALDEALQDKDELAAQAARFARETEAPFPAWLPAAVAVMKGM